MANIIRATTPTIKYTFSVVDPANITAAYMTIKKAGELVIEKALADASVDTDSLSWTLTQAETLSVAGNAEVMLNWLTGDGTRGASAPTNVTFTPNHISEVI